MSAKSQLSVCIIAKNAASTILECLNSVNSLSDDIVVVIDNSSIDNTLQIATDFGARVFSHDFINFADQKNFADSRAAHEWILSIDADESVSESLANHIWQAIGNSNYSAYSIRRLNFIFGRPIHHTNWDPHGLIRLFNKNKCRWEGDVHEEVKVTGKIGVLPGLIHHRNYSTVTQFMDKMNLYTSLEAGKMYSSGIRFTFTGFLWYPMRDFIRRFVWHAGFLDGWHGLLLSYLMVIYHLSVWVKLWQKQNSFGRS